jgi:dihydrolipoamide dehydrogenase
MADAFDVIVIGSGPAGYVCAIRAAQLGLKTAIVERDALGGICLNWGCIPTKALLRSSEIWHLMHRLGEFGFAADNLRFDLGKIVERSRKVSAQLSNGVAFLMKKNKIVVIKGEAKLAGAGRIAVTADGKSVDYAATNIVLATGARARTLEGLKPDGERIWTYMHAMVPKALPKSLLIVGSGAIGIEFASFYRTLGSEVTVVEALDRILPVEDAEISQAAAKAFARQGMKLHVSTTVSKIETGVDGVSAVLTSKDGKTETLNADRVIVAIGIVGNVENIGLENAGVKVEKTHVAVNQWGETGVAGLYAIGDLVGPPWLAHKGMHEGVIVAERIAGVKGIHPRHAPTVGRKLPASGSPKRRRRHPGATLRSAAFPSSATARRLHSAIRTVSSRRCSMPTPASF